MADWNGSFSSIDWTDDCDSDYDNFGNERDGKGADHNKIVIKVPVSNTASASNTAQPFKSRSWDMKPQESDDSRRRPDHSDRKRLNMSQHDRDGCRSATTYPNRHSDQHASSRQKNDKRERYQSASTRHPGVYEDRMQREPQHYDRLRNYDREEKSGPFNRQNRSMDNFIFNLGQRTPLASSAADLTMIRSQSSFDQSKQSLLVTRSTTDFKDFRSSNKNIIGRSTPASACDTNELHTSKLESKPTDDTTLSIQLNIASGRDSIASGNVNSTVRADNVQAAYDPNHADQEECNSNKIVAKDDTVPAAIKKSGSISLTIKDQPTSAAKAAKDIGFPQNDELGGLHDTSISSMTISNAANRSFALSDKNPSRTITVALEDNTTIRNGKVCSGSSQHLKKDNGNRNKQKRNTRKNNHHNIDRTSQVTSLSNSFADGALTSSTLVDQDPPNQRDSQRIKLDIKLKNTSAAKPCTATATADDIEDHTRNLDSAKEPPAVKITTRIQSHQANATATATAIAIAIANSDSNKHINSVESVATKPKEQKSDNTEHGSRKRRKPVILFEIGNGVIDSHFKSKLVTLPNPVWPLL